jgi:hypothetical protein
MSAFEELLRAWEPEVVAISNETGYAGRAAVTACRRLSVRSVGIQHGLISPHHIEYVNDSESMDRKVPWSCPYPDLTALDGHYYQRVLTEMGSYARSETLVTGQLRYEATRLALDAAKGRGHELVVATHPFDRERWITEVLAACGDLGPLMIKPHPLEDRGFYERILRGRPEARVVGDANIMSLMGSAVALVTGFSTTIVEAALAGCPSVLYNPSGGTEPIPFAALGGVVRAESPQELRRVVSEIIEGGEVRRRLEASRESFLGDFAFGGSVDCSKRLADAILKPSRI